MLMDPNLLGYFWAVVKKKNKNDLTFPKVQDQF